MGIFIEYLKSKVKVAGLVLIYALLFAIIFYFYNLEVEAVFYAIGLCILATIIVIIVDFYFTNKKHKKLIGMRNNIHITIDELPKASNIIERDYIRLLRKLFLFKRDMEYDNSMKHSEMIEYYTMWAHQIKTPISAMQLILQAEETEENIELLEQLFKIEQYADMVLQYLRSENMAGDLVIKEYSVETIVREVVRKYAKTFIRKKIHLELESLNVRVLTDKKWLMFVIEQLISNSLKYTNGGKIAIYMDPKKAKTLVIEDSGIGIKEEDLPRVFEKGFTGFNGRMNNKSTGIGLYLCKRILLKMSHTIDIKSKEGKGTTVMIGLDSMDLITHN